MQNVVHATLPNFHAGTDGNSRALQYRILESTKCFSWRSPGIQILHRYSIDCMKLKAFGDMPVKK